MIRDERENTRSHGRFSAGLHFRSQCYAETTIPSHAGDARKFVTVVTRQTNAPSPPCAGERAGVRWHG